jgi:hypothetical protein
VYRRRTVEAIQRSHERQQQLLLAVIREQNDRLMLLAGRPWAPSPLETQAALVEDEEPEEQPVPVGQLPDDLGYAW